MKYKKSLLFLLGFTALALVNSAKPMCEVLLLYTTHKLLHCFKKCTQQNSEDLPVNTNTSKKPMPIKPNPESPPTTTTIKYLSDEFLYKILGFLTNKEILDLRFVSKKFGHAIKMNKKLFKQNLRKHEKFCSDNQNKKKFTIKLNKNDAAIFIKNSLLLSLDNKHFQITLTLDTNTQDSFGFLGPWLQKLRTHLKINKNKLTSLALHYTDPEPYACFTPKTHTKICKSNIINPMNLEIEIITEMSINNKMNVYNEEFTMFHDLFDSIKKLTIIRCENFESPISWPKNLMELTIQYCTNFKIKYLENLPKLLKLYLNVNNRTCKDNALKNVGLKNLKDLTIENYSDFTGCGLPKNLSELRVKGCKNFDKKSVESLQLKCFSCRPVDDYECTIS